MKKKVSAFEYAISEAVGDTEFMKTHEPRTREEETQHRLNDILNQAKKLRIADLSNCDHPKDERHGSGYLEAQYCMKCGKML